MTTRRLFLAKLAGLAGFTLLSKAKGDYTKPLSLPVVLPRGVILAGARVGKSQPTTIDYDRLLYCISAVETNHQDHLVGPCGARSRYQISEAVWRQHHWGNGIPFTRCKGNAALGTAQDHLRWLDKQLGRWASVSSIAWCWKEGLEAYRRAHSNRASMSNYSHESYVRGMEYSRRVTNLYASGYNET